MTLTPRSRALEARELVLPDATARGKQEGEASRLQRWTSPELSEALRRYELATVPVPSLAIGLAPESDSLASEVASAALGLGVTIGIVSPLEGIALPLVAAHTQHVVQQAEEALRVTAAQNLALSLRRHTESDLAQRLEALHREDDVIRLRSEIASLLADPTFELAPRDLPEDARLVLVDAHVQSVQRRTYAAVALLEDDVADLQLSMGRLAQAATELRRTSREEVAALRADTQRLEAHDATQDEVLLELLPPQRARQYLVSGELGAALPPEERARRIEALRSAVALRRARETVSASREFLGALRDVSRLLPPSLQADVERTASFGMMAADVAAAILETPTNPLAAVRIVARLLGGGREDPTTAQLVELRRELVDLRRHVDRRFDRLEAILEANQQEIMSTLHQIGARLDRIETILIEHAGADLASCKVVFRNWRFGEERARLPLRLLERSDIRRQATECHDALQEMFVPDVPGLGRAAQAFFQADETNGASRLQAEMRRVNRALQVRNARSIDLSRDPVLIAWGAAPAPSIGGGLDLATPTDAARVGATVVAALELTPVFELQSSRTGQFCTSTHYPSRSGPCADLPNRTVGHELLTGYIAVIDSTEQQSRYRAAWPLLAIWFEQVLQGDRDWTAEDEAVLRHNETAAIEFGRYLVARAVREAGGSLAAYDYAVRRRSSAALARALGSPQRITFDFDAESPVAVCAGVRIALPTAAELQRRTSATAFLSGLGTVRAAVERERLGAEYYAALSTPERRLVDRLFETVSSERSPWRVR